MRIDLFAVWFMNGLLGQPGEPSSVFAMAPSATPAADSARAVVLTAASATTPSTVGYCAGSNSI